MKIFTTSDIHGRISAINKIVEFAKKRNDIDSIILCGDITGDYDWYSFNELEEKQYESYLEIKGLLESSGKKVKYILGNHDVFEVDKGDTDYLMYNRDGDFKNFVALEYTNFFMYGHKREGNEEDMRYRLEKLKVNDRSIIISHIPPFKCLDKDNNNINHGSKVIREMIKLKRPAYFICGHVHDDFGYRRINGTHVFNVACDEKSIRGWIVDFNKEKFESIEL